MSSSALLTASDPFLAPFINMVLNMTSLNTSGNAAAENRSHGTINTTANATLNRTLGLVPNATLPLHTPQTHSSVTSLPTSTPLSQGSVMLGQSTKAPDAVSTASSTPYLGLALGLAAAFVVVVVLVLLMICVWRRRNQRQQDPPFSVEQLEAGDVVVPVASVIKKADAVGEPWILAADDNDAWIIAQPPAQFVYAMHDVARPDTANTWSDGTQTLRSATTSPGGSDVLGLAVATEKPLVPSSSVYYTARTRPDLSTVLEYDTSMSAVITNVPGLDPGEVMIRIPSTPPCSPPNMHPPSLPLPPYMYLPGLDRQEYAVMRDRREQLHSMLSTPPDASLAPQPKISDDEPITSSSSNPAPLTTSESSSSAETFGQPGHGPGFAAVPSDPCISEEPVFPAQEDDSPAPILEIKPNGSIVATRRK